MNKHAPTDAELVTETLAGKSEKFGQLYDRHARMVRAVVAGVSGDWSAIDDMTQESFLRAYRNLAKLREPARFGHWIVGIARKVASERRRSLRRSRHEVSWPEVDFSRTEQGLEIREQLSLVMQRLSRLPEQERTAIHAYFLEQQDANAAAFLLGLSRSGFHALVQRALARLATRIECNKATKNAAQ